MAWICHPLSVPAFDQLSAAAHTHTAGYANGIDLIIPVKENNCEKNAMEQ